MGQEDSSASFPLSCGQQGEHGAHLGAQGGKELNPHVLPALPVSGPGMEIWKVLEHVSVQTPQASGVAQASHILI